MGVVTLSGSITQSAADVFVGSKIQTGLDINGNRALRLVRAQFEITANNSGVGGSEVEYALARQLKSNWSTIPTISDDSIVYKRKTKTGFTTSGWILREQVDTPVFSEDSVTIIEADIAILLDSSLTALVHALAFNLYFEEVTVTANDKIAILQSQLYSNL